MTRVENAFAEAEDVDLPSSDDEELTELEDGDTCSAFELEKSFQVKYKIADEEAVTLKKDYVLSLCQDSSFTKIAAGLSNTTVRIFDINQQSGLHNSNTDFIPVVPLINPNSPVNICGVHFLDESSNCLLVGTTDGVIRLFDLRAQHEQARFEDTPAEDGAKKAFTCFDRNANGRSLCAGTEQYQHNVFLIFYDVRERKQLGGYFESHQDDVTAVCFHSEDPDLICSGSTDGLINIFNIKEDNEDDALLTTINTESSVHKLNWHKNVYNKDVISCITHTNDFKLYDCEEADEIADFERSEITNAMKRKNPANCNLVDAHNTEDGGIFLLAGTNIAKGEILRSLQLQNKLLLPSADFDGNKQIVRESLYNNKTRAVVTAGESGIVTLWTASDQSTTTADTSNKLKSKTKSKTKKNTPY